MKKTITLVAGSESTKIALVNQLKEYIPNTVSIHSYALEKGIDHVISDHLVILSSQLIKEYLLKSNLLNPNCEMVVAKRTINYGSIDQIVLLPWGTDALFVNDIAETTYESIDTLKNLGIDYINYIPYFPGIENPYKKVPIAITPGERDKVPSFVEKIYDIGTRIMDFTTIVRILNKLDMPEEISSNFSQKYLKKIIHVAKRLANSNNKISELNQHLHLVIDGLNEGLLVYDKDGNISITNENLRQILKIPYPHVAEKSLKDVIYNKSLLEFLMDKNMMEGKIFTIDGVEILVNKFYLPKDPSIIAVFKSVKETMEVNKKLRMELFHKGFYAKYTFDDIVGESEAIKGVKDIGNRLSKSNLTILIEGESGTGKELFASAIHMASKRKKGPFLAVNFSALPDELIESELFGYEEGAFTGAKKGGKAGLFEQANGGTIFLDEIGDISLKVQARLLRVLQEKEVMRIGGSEIKPVDVRVIAATNRELGKMVQDKKFRGDLFYRLKMGYIHLPPLRNRKMDIYKLMDYFIKVETTEDIKISQDVMDELLKYDWHGNIRELKNTLTYMLAVKTTDHLTLRDMPDKGFFQEMICDEPLNEHKDMDTPLDDEQRFLLNKISVLNHQRILVGRERLSQETIGTVYEMTKYQVRRRLDTLEEMGLIIKRKGRHGTVLSSKGKKLLIDHDK